MFKIIVVFLVFWKFTAHSVIEWQVECGLGGMLGIVEKWTDSKFYFPSEGALLVLMIIVVCLVFWEFIGHSVTEIDR